MKKVISSLVLMLLIFSACQKEIWLDDIECLLTAWKYKTWVDQKTGMERRYYWSDPRRFTDGDSTWGLWYLPISGIIRETHFGKLDTTVIDYKVIEIDKSHFIKQRMDDSSGTQTIYHVK